MAKKLPFLRLFQYATGWDYFFLAIGTVSAVMIGALQPVLFYVLGNIYEDMGPESTAEDYFDQTVRMVYIILILSTIYIAVCYIAIVSWVYIGSRQSYHFRIHHFQSQIQQDPQWYDQQNLSFLSTALNLNAVKVERATGDKLVMIIMTLTFIFAGIVIDIIICLQLWLLSLAFLPLVGGGLVLTNIGMERTAKIDDSSYKAASSLTEELLPEMKTVLSLTAESSLAERYSSTLKTSFLSSFRSAGLTGVGTGLAVASYLGFLASAFVVAAELIDRNQDNWTRGDEISVASVIIVVLVSIMAFNSIGTFTPSLKMVLQGQLAAAEMMEIINSKPTITPGNWKGEVRGSIELRDVTFAYPSKTERKVLDGVSLQVAEGQRVAIVGESGSGKSTIVSLLLRFYDVSAGAVIVDGRDIKDWDLSTLRSYIGIVNQEPLLFHGSLRDNIRLNRADATDADIEAAVEKAQIGDFLRNPGKGLDITVGEKGSQLSGGEKQRVALARVIVRNPKVLLLDEATSALDTNTEKALMGTIEEALGHVTMVVVAHRISTVRNVDKIVVLNSGKVSECGSYEELMQKQGQFYHYACLQSRDYPESVATEASATQLTSTQAQEATALLEPAKPAEEPRRRQGYTARFLAMSRREGKWVLLGTLGSFLVSMSYPVTGMLLGLEVNTLSMKVGEELKSDAKYYAGFYGICIAVVLLGFLLESLSFPLAAAKVTRRIRKLAFAKMLTYDSAYFDQHSASALGHRLSNDCEKISNLNGSVFSALFSLFLSLLCAFVITGVYSWEILLVGVVMLPAFFFSIFANFIAQMEGLVSYEYEEALSLLSDATISHRTVKAFNLESYFTSRYTAVLQSTQKQTKARIHRTAVLFGLGFSMYLFCNALLFWFGAKMLVMDRVSYKDMNVAMFAFLSGTDMIALVALFAPDVKQGQEAAKHVFELLDYVPAISPNESGKRAPQSGSIEFRSVYFSYPTRPVEVLSNVSLHVASGSRLALVGQTGSGKSTIWQLLLRFYDPTEGSVLVDGVDTREYRLADLRRSIGVVGQEPVLFSGTVRYNISLGLGREPEEGELKTVLEDVQAASFLSDTPTLSIEVGHRGSKLSGGQKQRIALARALLRKPKIVIFDEATSALDSDTEASVIAGIAGRLVSCTSLVIAHRLKTIMGVGQVGVVHCGRLVELGSFEELMARKGYLYNLVGSQ